MAVGRPSKLKDDQWKIIEERMTNGESIRSLSREFKIGESSIRARLSAQVESIKNVSNQIVATDMALRALPISAQISAHNRAYRLRALSEHVEGSALFGAATAHRLQGIANSQIDLIDDSDPFSENNVKIINGVSAYTKVANDSNQTAINLIKANQSAFETMDKKEDKKQLTLADFYKK